MNWKKRTAQQVDESVSKKDYTGGYEFWPWLLYMRKWYVIGFLGNMSIGIGCFFAYLDSLETFTLGVSIFFGTCVPTLIGFLLRNEYKRLKIGRAA